MKKEPFLRSFFETLNQNNVHYFVFGSYKELPINTGGSDIDIFIKETDIKNTESILLQIAKKNNLIVASYYSNKFTKFYRLLAAEWGVQIDLFYKGFIYHGVSYFPTLGLQNSIYLHNGIVQVLEEERGYFIDYFKEVIHNGIVKEKYAEAVLLALEKDKEKCLSEIESLYGIEVAGMISQNNTLCGLIEIAKPLQIIIQKIITKGHSYSIIKDRISVLNRLFSKRPGYVIAVEGTDGSGKSFIIDSISPILNEAFHNEVKYNHLRPHWIPDIAVLFRKRKNLNDENNGNRIVTDPHAKKPAGFISSLFRWTYYLVDYTIGYLRKVWLPIHSRSKVFIFDRYYYEFFLDQKRSHINLPMWIVKMGEFIIPSPDLILCLGGDPVKIYARKPETSLLEVTRQTRVLKDFCSKRKNAVWIDTTIAPEESITAAMKAVMEVMSKRFDIKDLQ